MTSRDVIGTALVEILPDTSKFEAQLDQQLTAATRGAGDAVTDGLSGAEDAFSDLGTAGKESADEIQRSFGRDLLGSGALVAGAGVALGAITNFATGAIDAASALGESVNAVNVVFGEASAEVIAFGESAAESVGLSQRAFQEAAVPLGAMLQNFGLSAEDAADQTLILAERAADMASVFNVDVTEALGAIQAALRGETEQIRRFGVSVDEASLTAEALELGLIGVGEALTPTAKATAALSLIMEQTEGVAGDFAATSDSLANQQRILSANLEDASAAIGELLLPVASTLVGVVTDLVGGFTDLPEPIQLTAIALGGLTAVGGVAVVGLAGIVRSLETLGAGALTSGIVTRLGTVATFLTGPWGIAIGGAIAGLGFLAANAVESAVSIEELESALQGAQGDLEAATRTLFEEFAQESPDVIDLMTDLGISFQDLQRIIADPTALDAFIDRLESAEEIVPGLGDATHGARRALIEFLTSTIDQVAAQEQLNALMAAGAIEMEQNATATDELRVIAQLTGEAMTGAASATIEVADATDELSAAEEAALVAAEEMATFIGGSYSDAFADAAGFVRGLNDAFREQVDPVFAARQAMERQADIQEQLNTLIAEGKGDTEEAIDLAFDLAEAENDVNTALTRVSEEGLSLTIQDLRDLRDQGLINNETFRAMRRQIDDVTAGFELGQEPIEGYTSDLDNIPDNVITTLTTDGNAPEDVSKLKGDLEAIDGNTYNVTVNAALTGSGSGGLRLLDSGGPFRAGEWIVSGVPELFIPNFGGMAYPLTSTQVDRLLAGVTAIGTQPGPGGAQTVNVNISPGAIVVDRPSSTADVRSGVFDALSDIARTRLQRDGV